MTPAVAAVAATALAQAQAIVDTAMAQPAVVALTTQRQSVQLQIDELVAQLTPLWQQATSLDAQINDAIGPDARNAKDTIQAVQFVVKNPS
jgi:hypothetical protein